MKSAQRLDLRLGPGLHEIPEWAADPELRRLMAACIDAQRLQATPVYEHRFRPAADAAAAVSETALRQLLRRGSDVRGIAREREISNVIAFNARYVGDAVRSEEVRWLRRQVDARVTALARRRFDDSRLAVRQSGLFWYPPGSYMGWHTNSHAPGYRIYLTHTEEPGKSFFRYRHPESDTIVTCVDGDWNARIFRVDAHHLFWHAVYSETHRFSLGYLIYRPSWLHRMRVRALGLLARRRLTGGGGR